MYLDAIVEHAECVFRVFGYIGNFGTARHSGGTIKLSLRGKLLRFQGESGMMKVQIDL